VDLRVLQGQTLAVVGAAGAGKTTLARTLLRLVPATAGRVVFDGKELLGASKSALREQQGQLQLVSSQGLLGADALAALRAVTALEPKLLIFDEAFAHLAASVRLQLFDHIRQRQDARGLTCLLLTRDIRLAGALADELIVLLRGQVVEAGAATSTLSKPYHPYTQRLLQLTEPPARPEPPAAPGEPAACHFRADCPRALPRCRHEAPSLFVVPGGLSRCFLQDSAAAADGSDAR
jgi:ABC-type glutathione transport system ATPase component